MTPHTFLAAACLACVLAPAAAAPLRLALRAEGPQDLMLDAAPERPAVQYVPHDRPPAEPDTDIEAERGVAQAVDAHAPADMLESLAPEPAAVHDASTQGWLAHDADPDAAPLVAAVADAAADDTPALTEVESAQTPPAAAPPDRATAQLDEVESNVERRRLQRLAVQWTVVPLLLVSLGLWWMLGRQRRRRRSDGSPVVKAVSSSRHGGHRQARRRA